MPNTNSGLTLDEIAQRLEAVAHRDPSELDAHLIAIDAPSPILGSAANLRCHVFAVDGAGRHKHKHLARMLVDRTLDFAIPRSEIARAKADDDRSGRSTNMKRLARDADRLFARVQNAGEGGELLLYALTDVLLQAPQVLCKMALKTNTQMHVHGSDGIHATVDPVTKRLVLYWGESKLHGKLSQAISECFQSVAPFLLDDGPDGHTYRDLALLRAHADFDDPALEEALRHFLDPDDPDFNRMEPRAVCLVGFSKNNYPDPFDPDDRTKLSNEMARLVKQWSTKVGTAIVGSEIHEHRIEVFCVPFPSVKEFRDSFMDALR